MNELFIIGRLGDFFHIFRNGFCRTINGGMLFEHIAEWVLLLLTKRALVIHTTCTAKWVLTTHAASTTERILSATHLFRHHLHHFLLIVHDVIISKVFELLLYWRQYHQ